MEKQIESDIESEANNEVSGTGRQINGAGQGEREGLACRGLPLERLVRAEDFREKGASRSIKSDRAGTCKEEWSDSGWSDVAGKTDKGGGLSVDS